MAEVKKSKILNYINVFRGLAILLIVAGHTMQVGEAGSFLQRLSVEVFAGGTALFIFISGFLFQHLSGKYEFSNYMSKKWANVIQPYLWTAIPGILFCFLFPLKYGNSFDGLNYIYQIPMMLSIGRVHNTPAWFIPMIILFFLSSWVLLFLERKNILYKLLPVLFLITIFMPRIDVDYNTTINLMMSEKYIAYIKYVFMGYVHFFSMYVFGMYCSFNKNIIDKFWDYRYLYLILMLIFAALNVYSGMNFNYSNGTLSKIFLTILLLAYLKHYDAFILSHEKINTVLDFIAKYSFGIFFIHWYVFFIYNSIFNLSNVLNTSNNSLLVILGLVFLRFITVTVFSILILFAIKCFISKFFKNANSRSIIGV
ncbi:acyltransferase [bacterium]|nr:acyltransferase [bacterium]